MRTLPLLGLAAGLLVVLPAPAAVAAGGITSPTPDTVVTAEVVVPLRAFVESPAVGPSELTLQGPLDAAPVVVAVQTSPDGGELAHDFDTACGSQVCADRTPVRNGTWTLRLDGAAQDERAFELRIPPAAPSGVEAVPADGGIELRWERGPEPDLTGYLVVDADGVEQRLGVDGCTGRSCALVVAPSPRWSVLAARATCPECDEELLSPPVEVLAPELPVAQQRPAQVPDQAAAFASRYAVPRQQVAAVEPRAAAPPRVAARGSYDTTLGYAAPPVGGAASLPVETGGDAAYALTGQRALSFTVAGVLVALSLWLRGWARRRIVEET